jgi:hypothetical protein
MVTLNIHWETFNKQSFEKVKELAKKGPIAISIAPYQISKMSGEQINWLKKVLSNPDYVLGQQGLNHKCTKCAAFHKTKENAGVDPWHENYCLWFSQIPEHEQEKFMQQGKEQLKKTFNVEPRLYVPPNHYFDETTIKIASKLGYSWLSDRAKIPLKPYYFNGIIIIPESEPEIEQNKQLYIHADRWRGNLDKAISQQIESLKNIKPVEEDKTAITKNRKLKITLKIARDLHKGFDMSKENSEKAAQLLFETKFNSDAFL